MKIFYKKNNQRLGPFTLEEFKCQPINRHTLVWYEGLPDWSKLKDVPSLTEIYNSLPPEKREFKLNKKLLFTSVGVASIVIAIIFYLSFKSLKPLTTEQLYNQYAKSVVLIKHGFVYKIKIAGADYYFKSYNNETGEISELLSLEEAKKDLNIVWGTGFFIDEKGTILTCRHVVDVKPSNADEKLILDNFRLKSQVKLINIRSSLEEVQSSYSRVKQYFDIYSPYMNSYEYSQYSTKLEELKSRYEILNSEVTFWEYFSTLTSDPENLVTKTSLQFGIFLDRKSVV